jgi:hypothetical protein
MLQQLLLLLQLCYAPKTYTGTPTRPPPYEHSKPFYKRIDDLIIAMYCTKDLLLKDSQAGLLKALALLREAYVIVVLYTIQIGLNKPKDTELIVS